MCLRHWTAASSPASSSTSACAPRTSRRPTRRTTSTPMVHGRAEPGPARRVPERADAEGARGARDRGDPRLVRVLGAAGDRGRARRRRVPHVARLPALAVPLAALQPPHGPLGRLVRESAALPDRGDAQNPHRDRRRAPSSATGSTRPRSGPATSSSRTSSGSSPTSSARRTSTSSTSRPASTTRTSTPR